MNKNQEAEIEKEFFLNNPKKSFKVKDGGCIFQIDTDEKKFVKATITDFYTSSPFTEEEKTVILCCSGFASLNEGDKFSMKKGTGIAIRNCRKQMKDLAMGELAKYKKSCEGFLNQGKAHSRLQKFFKSNSRPMTETEKMMLQDLGNVMLMVDLKMCPGNALIGWEDKIPAAAYMAYFENEPVPIGKFVMTPEFGKKMILTAKLARYWPKTSELSKTPNERFCPHRLEKDFCRDFRANLAEQKKLFLEEMKRQVEKKTTETEKKPELTGAEKLKDIQSLN